MQQMDQHIISTDSIVEFISTKRSKRTKYAYYNFMYGFMYQYKVLSKHTLISWFDSTTRKISKLSTRRKSYRRQP